MTGGSMRVVRGALAVVLGGAVAVAACAGRTSPGSDTRGPTQPPTRTGAVALPVDAIQVYRQMGLLADAGPVPYVGRIAFLAGARPDSTTLLVSLSIASRSLTFHREGDQYRATYRVAIEVRRAGVIVRQISSSEVVRVASFKETTRSDESVIFQQIFSVSPGAHVLSISVFGEDATKAGDPLVADIDVPRYGGNGGLSSPIAFYSAAPRLSADSLPRIIPTPRSTVVFGRDSVLPVYIEAYGPGDRLALGVGVVGERQLSLWTDSAVVLTRHGAVLSGVVNVPVARLGIGVTTLSMWRYDSPDTVRTPVFITFGEDLPVATMDQMIAYLRYYTFPGRLRAIRDTTPEARAKLWAQFLAETDPNPATAEHEGLRDYFQRINIANARFRDEGGSGWMTDRGMVFVTLGEPDQVLEPTAMAMNERGRIQVWEYRSLRLQLQFVDQSGFGRWRLTPGSQSEFMSAARRVQAG